tara:strand:- start:61 stop:246 length:186 start_codon:yes stop_codon:yes gene_type:complete
MRKMISPLGYMIYYQDKENIKKKPIELKKIKKKKLKNEYINDFETKINKIEDTKLIAKYFT